ncbi:MAG: type II toxin-antitoxin system VapC family toxin [Betaproteobacteria bacterium]|jgi:predicted nucleic acid-binding protein
MQLSDTNVISELMRPSPDTGVAAWASSQRTLCISVITVDELVFGLRRRGSARLLSWFDRFIEQVQVLDISPAVARRAGEMRALLQSGGQVRTQADMMIAATAQVHGLTLVTRNMRDFDGCGVAVLNPFSTVPMR